MKVPHQQIGGFRQTPGVELRPVINTVLMAGTSLD
jgi:hypothetical protein